MQTQEFLAQARIKADMLDRWLEDGWLIPARTAPQKEFSEVDLARAQLICDLREIGVNDEAVPIVLDLIDQMHGLRRKLRALILASENEDPTGDRPQIR